MEGLDTKRSQRYAMSTSTNHSINIKKVENRCHLAQKKPMRAYAKSRKSGFSKPLKLFLRIKDLVRQNCPISQQPLTSVMGWPITISRIKRLFLPPCYNKPCRGRSSSCNARGSSQG